MNEVFLGVIAVGILVMAALQLVIVVVATRAARHVVRLSHWIEDDLRPVISSLRSVATDAAKAVSVAGAQIERIDGLSKELAKRVEETAAGLQSGILAPLRDGRAVIEGLRAVLSSLRDLRNRPRGRRQTSEDEEGLFIG
jgi:hypothetical protein